MGKTRGLPAKYSLRNGFPTKIKNRKFSGSVAYSTIGWQAPGKPLFVIRLSFWNSKPILNRDLFTQSVWMPKNGSYTPRVFGK